MIHLKKNASIVIQTITKYRYGPRAVKLTKECFDSLMLSLEEEEIEIFSLPYALDWCLNKVAKSKQPQFKNAILKLADVYEYGKVHSSHLLIYSQPSKSWKDLIESYISDVMDAGLYSITHLRNIRNTVTQFCCFAEYNGLPGIEALNYDILEQYDRYMRESSKAFYINEGLVSVFLKHLADTKGCKPGFGLFMHYIESGKCTHLGDLSPEAARTIEMRRADSESFPACEFYDTIPDFMERMSAWGYSKGASDSARYYLTLLYLFLDREGLGYDRVVVESWFTEISPRLFGHGALVARRTYELYDDYTHEGDILPSHRWKHCETIFDRLPSWCKNEAGEFIANKRREGWSGSTVRMFQVCVAKFCSYLAGTGIGTFGEISPADIKDFNINDRHKTPEAKNAYNSRIRKFLIYLELKGLVPAGIHFALPGHAAAGVKIVDTLDDRDMAAIRNYCSSASTPLALRDSAILLIALDTGIRSSDIVGMDISSIDWKQKCIRIVQKKTGVERIFPIETGTCNAIFRYLKDARRRGTGHDALFLSVKAPYGRADRSACRNALLRAGASTAKTHLVRKSFGSITLNSGASVKETAVMLGHSDTSTVHKYTSLDSDRSRLCPLSLAETGLSLEGRYGRHE